MYDVWNIQITFIMKMFHMLVTETYAIALRVLQLPRNRCHNYSTYPHSAEEPLDTTSWRSLHRRGTHNLQWRHQHTHTHVTAMILLSAHCTQECFYSAHISKLKYLGMPEARWVLWFCQWRQSMILAMVVVAWWIVSRLTTVSKQKQTAGETSIF